MKAKTRILAMLLTVLMVVGMLPLALFAAAGDTPSEAVKNTVSTNKTWESVKATLANSGVDPYIYQNFDNIEDSKFTNNVVNLLAGHRAEWSDLDDSAAVVDYGINFTAKGTNPFEAKNYRGSLKVVKEASGNKALYVDAAATVGNSNDDTWFDIETDNVGGGNDLFVSVDFKMKYAVAR